MPRPGVDDRLSHRPAGFLRYPILGTRPGSGAVLINGMVPMGGGALLFPDHHPITTRRRDVQDESVKDALQL